MNIRIGGEDERVEEIGNEDQEDESGIYIPTLEDQFKLSINLLKQRWGVCCHDDCCNSRFSFPKRKKCIDIFAVRLG